MAPADEDEISRRALVVGAARGIGRATALGLADAGHEVTGTWHRAEPEPHPDLSWRRCDVTDAVSVDALFAGEPFDIVVASAAIIRDRLSSRMTDEDFATVLAVDLTGTFRVARAALASMVTRRWGRLVFVSSVGGWFGNAGQANYAAAKSGQLGMARSLAREVGPRGVTVNVLVPGPVATELIASMPKRRRAQWTSTVPAQRMADPREIAAVAVFLTSEQAGSITGAMVRADGGWLA